MRDSVIHRRMIVLSLAAVATTGALVQADIVNGNLADPRTYVISTSGATALGALTRGAATNSNNNPTGEQNGLWRLGVNGYQIGRSTYTFGTSNPVQQYLSYRNGSVPINGEGSVRTADHIVYQYSEVGSINGVLNTVKSGGLFIPNGLGNQVGPGAPSQSAPLWINGWKQINATTFQVDGAGTTAGIAGGWNPYAGQPASEGGQLQSRIGYSDVRSFQAFAVDDVTSAPASPDRRPRDLAGTGIDDRAQYGIGRSAYNPITGTNGTNFQALANRSVISGETDNPNDSHLRNETLAIVPFAVAANPGTGIVRMEENEVRWLNGMGRLPNGANFNSVTREIGSGTRNQGANNLNIDASWAGGERDRRYLDEGNVGPVTALDTNGNLVTIQKGDELSPAIDLNGVNSSLASSEQPKEHRVGPMIRFSDKNSGGSGVRPVVVNNRIAISPNLSVGDVGDRGIGGTSASGTDPIRVIGVKWSFEAGETGANTDYTQPTAVNVATGRYQQWSAAQAVTVIGIDTNGDGTFDALGTVGTDSDPNRPIFSDTIDYTGSKGLHRNWLNNITQSVATFGSATTNVTPSDAVIAAGFIPQQLMQNDKAFDGGTQFGRTLSAVDPDGAGPARSEQELYDLVVAASGPGTIGARLNWADPASINGNLDANYTYKIFARDVSATSTTPTKSIVIKSRTSLAGDMNNDGVRDVLDVTDLAKAYAASESAGILGNSAVDLAFGAQTISSDDVIVLTDFNGDGNISGSNASPNFVAVDRDDVIYFLKGATIDTVNANASTGYAGSTSSQTRREDGVRLGKLVKNAAIDQFNADFLAAGGNPALLIRKSDVDNDGVIDLQDARLIDSYVGVAPFSLTLAETMVNFNVDPIYAELTDDNLISAVLSNGTSDFAVLKGEIGSLLVAGDTNFDGGVDFDDLLTLAQNYSVGAADQWSDGDFDLNGVVNFDDLLALAQAYSADSLVNGEMSKGFAAEWALAQSIVPEPTVLAGLGMLGIMARRRRTA